MSEPVIPEALIEVAARSIAESVYANNARRSEEAMYWCREYAKRALTEAAAWRDENGDPWDPHGWKAERDERAYGEEAAKADAGLFLSRLHELERHAEWCAERAVTDEAHIDAAEARVAALEAALREMGDAVQPFIDHCDRPEYVDSTRVETQPCGMCDFCRITIATQHLDAALAVSDIPTPAAGTQKGTE